MIIKPMDYINRKILPRIEAALARGKSILFLGPRQTGKTTLIKQKISVDAYFSLLDPRVRVRYEKDPLLLAKELDLVIEKTGKKPLIFIDEIQKIPQLMDLIQLLIDADKAQFILTGSSARKLKHGAQINLLPGRVVIIYMDSLSWQECKNNTDLDDILIYGSLPNVIMTKGSQNKNDDLYAYTSIYLEEEVRAEALVRNIGGFARFLELAASESGSVINASKLSQFIGVAQSTIADYYQILEDCLITFRIDPIIKTKSKRRLIKAPKYLFFDLGVRRACANEGPTLSLKTLGDLFEQFVGLELIRYVHMDKPHAKVHYWKDASGPEVDFVLENEQIYIPIEVKWSENPNLHDAKHLIKFLEDYPNAPHAYIICRTPHAYAIHEKITALPWQEIISLFEKI